MKQLFSVQCIVLSSGDLGQTYNSLSTLQHYMDSGAKSVLFVGDLSYADRYKYGDVGIRWDTWGRFVEQSAAYQPWIWSAGNHEIEYMPYMVKFCNTAQVQMFNIMLFPAIFYLKTNSSLFMSDSNISSACASYQ